MIDLILFFRCPPPLILNPSGLRPVLVLMASLNARKVEEPVSRAPKLKLLMSGENNKSVKLPFCKYSRYPHCLHYNGFLSSNNFSSKIRLQVQAKLTVFSYSFYQLMKKCLKPWLFYATRSIYPGGQI